MAARAVCPGAGAAPLKYPPLVLAPVAGLESIVCRPSDLFFVAAAKTTEDGAVQCEVSAWHTDSHRETRTHSQRETRTHI